MSKFIEISKESDTELMRYPGITFAEFEKVLSDIATAEGCELSGLVFRIESVSDGYGWNGSELVVSRPETEAEMEKRVESQRRRTERQAKEREDAERAEFERLKARFGNG